MEKLNIEGKRSGQGFVAHKAKLVEALSRALADRISLCDVTIGRRGLLNVVRTLQGNMVKVVPDDHSLKVIAGNTSTIIADGDYIGEKTPMTIGEVEVRPHNTVTPNIGSLELAEALNRVLPFTATEDNRPVLQCVKFEAKDGKLTMVSADGFRLAVVSLDYDGEGQALINRDDLKGIARALAKAKRVNIGFERKCEQLDGYDLVINTELISYKLLSNDGSFPDWQKLIPSDFTASVSFDSVAAIKAVATIRAVVDSKSYPIDLTIGEGKVTLESDIKAQVDILADTDGEGFMRIDGKYLADACRACGGMVELKLTSPASPMLFTTNNGYQLVTMPMMTQKATDAVKATQTEAEPEPAPEPEAEVSEAVAEAEAITEAEAEDKPKRKRKAKEPVAVA